MKIYMLIFFDCISENGDFTLIQAQVFCLSLSEKKTKAKQNIYCFGNVLYILKKIDPLILSGTLNILFR